MGTVSSLDRNPFFMECRSHFLPFFGEAFPLLFLRFCNGAKSFLTCEIYDVIDKKHKTEILIVWLIMSLIGFVHNPV